MFLRVAGFPLLFALVSMVIVNLLSQLTTDIRSSWQTPPPANGVILALGAAHTCLVNDDSLQCWGNNQAGQLGDGDYIDRLFPVDVIDFDESIIALSAGDNHTCALTIGGDLFCWGDNIQGQLGDGTTANRNRPTQVDLPDTVRAVTTGARHTCVLTEIRGVLCWGDNTYGQLGNSKIGPSSDPVAVDGLDPGVVSIDAGGNHTCALTDSGSVQCWGEHPWGQLDQPDRLDPATPVDIDLPLGQIESISVGDSHACALTALGTVLCWGRNNHGQLGDGSTEDHPVPVDLGLITSRVHSIAVGGDHTCALTTTGTVICWGANRYGQLGTGATEDRYSPVMVNSLYSQVVALEAGVDHTCAFSANGNLYCWGDNRSGQLGDDSWTNHPMPVLVGVQPPLSPTPTPTSPRTATMTATAVASATAASVTASATAWTMSSSTATPTPTTVEPSTATPTPSPTSTATPRLTGTLTPTVTATSFLWMTPTPTPTTKLSPFRRTTPTVTVTPTLVRLSIPTWTPIPTRSPTPFLWMTPTQTATQVAPIVPSTQNP